MTLCPLPSKTGKDVIWHLQGCGWASLQRKPECDYGIAGKFGQQSGESGNHMTNKFLAGLGLAGLALVSFTSAAVASQAEDWQLGLQESATPVMTDLVFMHDWILMPIITIITLFVLGLLLWVMIQYNAGRNPTPSKFTHNFAIEVAWTLIPVAILVVISLYSFPLLYKQDRIPEADMTIKAIGSSWYWSYEYPDHDDISITALMVPEDELKEGQPRLLATDENVVVPVNATVRVQVTSTDVIHAWTIPAFGIKMDAVPGRLNETWFKAEREGMFYGQCSELCGKDHAYMPIAVEVVSQEKFDEWVKTQTAANDTAPNTTEIAQRAD